MSEPDSPNRPDRPAAYVGGRLCTGLCELTDDPGRLDSGGFWVVVVEFEGRAVFARFAQARRGPLPTASAGWSGPDRTAWTSSVDERRYRAGVAQVRRRIATGEVYQVNLCRVMSAPLPPDTDLLGLAQVLAAGNPAPYAAWVDLPGMRVVSASPELFLRRRGDRVESKPIKGTGRDESDLLAKDVAENVMIVDLVRNDLARVASEVTVPALLVRERHPGLVHLVSTVSARLRPDAGWPELLAATFPPGSVSGAPKWSALRVIAELEPVARGPYCGAIGYVDADRREGALAVGIRIFWTDGPRLCFGTGAGITWGSQPAREWAETELKAARLVGLASGSVSGGGSGSVSGQLPGQVPGAGLSRASPRSTVRLSGAHYEMG